MKRRRGRPPTKGLTPTLEKSLRFIHEFIMLHGFPPTAREIAEEKGIHQQSAREQLVQLEKKGYIRRTPKQARSIEILRMPPTGGISPVFIVGQVAAGIPIYAEENIVGEILVEERYAQGHCFALRVVGDSMINAGIHEGDYVIVRQQPLAQSGDIVVAFLNDDEATLKRLYISETKIELRPENKNYEPISIGHDDNLRIVGKVVAVRHRTDLPPD
ncbi:transcriptional repressor LexA [Magnetococcales bacterium HHB-1]